MNEFPSNPQNYPVNPFNNQLLYSIEAHELFHDQKLNIYLNCEALYHYEDFYVNAAGKLDGYVWYNLPGRLFLWIQNYFSEGRVEEEAALSIENTFTLILKINKTVTSDYFRLGCVRYQPDITYSVYYETLAQRVIQRFSQHSYPTLYELALRILNERRSKIPLEDPETKQIVYRANCCENAVGTPYENTTAWKRSWM